MEEHLDVNIKPRGITQSSANSFALLVLKMLAKEPNESFSERTYLDVNRKSSQSQLVKC